MKPTQHHWLRLHRDAALTQQNGRCRYCKTPLRRDEATADHIKPRVRYGSNQSHNIVAACGDCNVAKGSLPAGKFWRAIKGHNPVPLKIAVCRAKRRINKDADRACKRILQFAGAA